MLQIPKDTESTVSSLVNIPGAENGAEVEHNVLVLIQLWTENIPFEEAHKSKEAKTSLSQANFEPL